MSRHLIKNNYDVSTLPKLRPLSDRPGLVVDDRTTRIQDPATGAVVGHPAPFGRERLVWALANAGQPEPLRLAAVTDQANGLISDPARNLIGRARVWIPRMVYATRTESTRR